MARRGRVSTMEWLVRLPMCCSSQTRRRLDVVTLRIGLQDRSRITPFTKPSYEQTRNSSVLLCLDDNRGSGEGRSRTIEVSARS